MSGFTFTYSQLVDGQTTQLSVTVGIPQQIPAGTSALVFILKHNEMDREIYIIHTGGIHRQEGQSWVETTSPQNEVINEISSYLSPQMNSHLSLLFSTLITDTFSNTSIDWLPKVYEWTVLGSTLTGRSETCDHHLNLVLPEGQEIRGFLRQQFLENIRRNSSANSVPSSTAKLPPYFSSSETPQTQVETQVQTPQTQVETPQPQVETPQPQVQTQVETPQPVSYTHLTLPTTPYV